ncbi:MAG: hypothetical protein IT497_07015 [Ottowia sp.]|nr:hypothetical protein [Ottowia sp.]
MLFKIIEERRDNMTVKIKHSIEQPLVELALVDLLCRGIHPETGEVLNTQRDPKLDQARLNYLKALQLIDKRLLRETQEPDQTTPNTVLNQGARWSDELDGELIKLWRADDLPTLDKLAVYFGRTEGAIVARLVRLQIASDREEIREQNQLRKRTAQRLTSAE